MPPAPIWPKTLPVALALLAFNASAAMEPVLRVGLATGRVRLTNPGPAPITIDGYTIGSLSESLLPVGWLPVTDNYDLSGDQSVDSVSEWFILSAAIGDLSEASQTSMSGAIAGDDFIDLGPLWDTSGATDLTFLYSVGLDTFSTTPEHVLEGDLDGDGVVGLTDYTLWRDTLGTVGVDPPGDADWDGDVDDDDFAILQSQFGGTTPVPIAPVLAASAALAAVPEPASGALAALAGAAFLATGRRRRVGS